MRFGDWRGQSQVTLAAAWGPMSGSWEQRDWETGSSKDGEEVVVGV